VRAPAFWSVQPPTLAARLLHPIGIVYGAATSRRMARPGAKIGIPIIAIGNFTAGGAGKTPTAIAVARHLQSLGHRPVFVSRGYGGRLAGPILVDVTSHDARDVGDEPLLLARTAPTIVARDRAAGGFLARAHGSVLILDDALQNADLAKDITIAVVDAVAGFGNGLCIPAGPLRAPIEAQLPFVDAVLSIGGVMGDNVSALSARPSFRGHLIMPDSALEALHDLRLLAFAGIGRPSKFFDQLRESGLNLGACRAFADHHVFSATEIAALTAEAAAGRMTLVTTEKDYVRLTRRPENAEFRAMVKSIPVALESPELLAWLTGHPAIAGADS
jgi:tetraacyldisaccharide 4'-kinase